MGQTIEEKKAIIEKEINKKKEGKYASEINFRLEIEKTLTNDEKKYIRDPKIEPFYLEITKKAYKKIHEKQIEEIKANFKNNIYSKINVIYSSLCAKKEDLDKKVKGSLSYTEKSFLDESNKAFDKNISTFYNSQLNAFWNEISTQRDEDLKVITFKNSIRNKQRIIYSKKKDRKGPDDLDNEFRKSLSKEENNWLNIKVNDYYNGQLNSFWNETNTKINEELKKKEEEKNKNINTFKENIKDIITNIYLNNKDSIKKEGDLRNYTYNSLNDMEKSYLKEKSIEIYFDSQIKLYMEEINKQQKDKLKNDIGNIIFKIYHKNKDIISEKSLDDKIRNSLDDDTKSLLNDIIDDYNRELGNFWNEIKDKKEQKESEKKTLFKNNISIKITNAYEMNKDVKEKSDLDKEIRKDFNEEEKKFLSEADILKIYNNNLDILWEKIVKQKTNILQNKKKNLRLDIDNKITKVYSMEGNIKTKKELDTKFKEYLDDEEKICLDEIKEFYDNKINNFWNTKLKDGIFNRINDAYEKSKYSEKKEEFINSIKSNLNLTEEENNILKIDSISKEFNTKLDILWNNSEKEREFNELIKQQDIRLREQDLKLKQLEDLNKEKDDQFKEKQNEINNLIKKQEEQVLQLKTESAKRQEEFDKENEKLLNDTANQIKAVEERIKKENDEIIRKREEEEKLRLKKIEKINKNFYNEIENLKLEKIKNIKNKIKEKENEFCMEEIANIDKNIITELVDKIFENDKIDTFILDKLVLYINKNKDKIKNAKHLNIILVGPSGVGKSTLINAVLDNENETETGFGHCQTQGIEYHESDKISFLRLADTRGIEKNEQHGVSGICKDVQDFIDMQLKGEPDKYIHCIWYCWKGTRLEDSEVSVLKTLSKQYTHDTLPVIIVYTNAFINVERERAEDYVKSEKGLNLKNIFIPVLSKEIKIDDKIIAPFGLDTLIEKSIDLAKNAVKSSCYEGLKKEIKDNINTEINALTEQIKNNIDNEIKKININLNKNTLEDVYKDNFKLILSVYCKYIFLNSTITIQNYEKPEVIYGKYKFNVSNDSKIAINNFVVNYYKQIIEIKEKNAQKLIESYSNDLTNDIISYQLDYNNKNDHLLQCSWTKDNLNITIKNFISENISKDLEISALKNSFNFLIEPLLELFGEYFISMYQLGMEEESFEKRALEVILVSFEDLEKKIKEYGESKRKKYQESIENQEAPTPQQTKLNLTKNHIRGKFFGKKGK